MANENAQMMQSILCIDVNQSMFSVCITPLTFVVIIRWRNCDLIGLLQIICWHKRLLLRRHFADCE